ncbi:MAG: CAP domain-containing protein [Lachnospiraceae bacterium]|nr:CAP domain-containing protein [Lachnospiraceae bacterium]
MKRIDNENLYEAMGGIGEDLLQRSEEASYTGKAGELRLQRMEEEKKAAADKVVPLPGAKRRALTTLVLGLAAIVILGIAARTIMRGNTLMSPSADSAQKEVQAVKDAMETAQESAAPQIAQESAAAEEGVAYEAAEEEAAAVAEDATSPEVLKPALGARKGGYPEEKIELDDGSGLRPEGMPKEPQDTSEKAVYQRPYRGSAEQREKEATERLVELLSAFREEHDVTVPVISEDLSFYASVRAEETAIRFSHERTNGNAFWTVEMFGETAVAAELFARGEATPEAFFEAFCESEAHRELLLNPAFGQAGIRVYEDNQGLLHVVILFAE